MSQPWYPDATKDEFKDAGAWQVSGPWKGVLHTTEGDSYAGARSVYGQGVAPHFTVSFEGGRFRVWQHIALTKSARALAHPAGTVETNRTRCIQIEIVAHAATSGTLQHEYLDGIGKLMRWVEANTEIQHQALKFHGPNEGIVLATATSPVRLSPQDWLNFSGWCGHQHVPVNDHWDPGAIDIDYLMSISIGVKPMYDPPLPIELVASCNDPENGGAWLLDKNGGVLSAGTAQFHGTPFGKDYWNGRIAARIDWAKDVDSNSPYKYIVTATSGEKYGYPE